MRTFSAIPIRRLTSSLVMGMAALAATRASADEGADAKQACAGAYEQAQELRASGQLRDAREKLRLCVQDQCSDFIRGDCRTWLGEVEATIPSVVFAVRRAGEDLSLVKVFKDDRLWLDKLDGKAVELDPGLYKLRFEAPGTDPVTRELVIRAGEKNRMVSVELVARRPPVAEPVAQPVKPAGRSRTIPLVLGGVGVVGLASFAVFGALGRAEESDLKQRCAPRCSDQQVSPVRIKYLVADISLGVGVLALAAGAYFFFRPERAESSDRASVEVDLRPTSHGGWATLGTRF